MMVMTSVSERPVTEPAGTIGAAVCLGSARRERVRGPSPGSSLVGGPVRTPVVVKAGAPVCGPSKASCSMRGRVGCSAGGPVGLSYDPDMAVMQLQPRRFGLAHQLMVVRGDDDRGPEPIELDEKPQQAACHLRVDVPRRLICQQQLGLVDDGARNGRALLLTA